jgi:mono/diheme cytochrome c family protein
MNRSLARSMLLAAALLPLGCGDDPTLPRREFVPEMVDSVPYDSFAANPVTRDGKTLQRPPEGTIPRGYYPFHYGDGPEEAAKAGNELKSPYETPTPADLARGSDMFGIFCTPCHGKGGGGDGPIIPKFPTPPSLTAAHAKGLKDGTLYHIITRGQNTMPSYATQVLPDDRWKIVAHIRTLQGGGK